MGNVGIYSVGRDRVYQIRQNSKTECFAGISQEGLTHETLAKASCLHLVLTLRIPVMCRVYASLCGKLTFELPAKPALVFNCLKSSHSFSITHKYRIYKIEQNYNQIWHEIKVNIN